MCDITGSCGCVTGYASHSNKTECLLNQIFSPCSFNAECFQAVSNSSCVNETCACDMGFYSTNLNQTCTVRQVGDSNCEVHGDCSQAVSNSECHNGESISHEFIQRGQRVVKCSFMCFVVVNPSRWRGSSVLIFNLICLTADRFKD